MPPAHGVLILFLSGIAICFIDFKLASTGKGFATNLRQRQQSSTFEVSASVVSSDDSISQRDLASEPDLILPEEFDYLVHSEFGGLPVLWYLPRSGGGGVAEILGQCAGAIVAGKWEHPTALATDDEMKAVFHDGAKHIPINFADLNSVNQDQLKGLADKTNLLVSHDLVQTKDLFDEEGKGQLWAWLRHPVDQQVSYFAHKKSLDQDHPEFDYQIGRYHTVAEWARSSTYVDNVMLRSLLGKPATGPVYFTKNDLDIAKELLRRKAHIGLLERKGESVARFVSHFPAVSPGFRECEERLLQWAWPNKNRHTGLEENTESYELLATRNEHDMELYNYAKQLFALQKPLTAMRDDQPSDYGKRNIYGDNEQQEEDLADEVGVQEEIEIVDENEKEEENESEDVEADTK
mmetsp:Transcript_5640/g.8688  ORF Transcript_5640/g.8688 Transcript_5640/m.8688 type:complete len:407 (+) Transcript_5640:166-1386(+)